MKSFVTIIAASAILSASLVAGLAASDTAHTAPSASVAQRSVTEPAPKPVAAKVPANVDTACRDAAWPYRPVLCAEPNGAAPRNKVRVISSNGVAPAAPILR